MKILQDTYKDTKIGRIPKDWDVVILNDLLNLLTDFEANGSFASVKENVRVSESIDYAWYVRATDLEKKSTLDKVKYVNESSYSFLKKTKLNGDEVLITKRGEIGKVYHFIKPIETPSTLAPNLYLLKLNDKVFSKYLYYYFKNNEGNKLLKRINGSTTIGALYKNDVKKIKVKLPPLPEQQKIAAILSTVDEQISTTDQIIEKSKELKKGLMQKLFSEGIGHTEFKDTKIGRIPKDWEVVKLGNIGTVIDSLHQTPKFSAVGYPMVRVGDINKSKLNLKNCLTVPIDVFKAFTKKHIPTNGDILITRVGSFGKTILVENDSPFCLGQNTAVITGLSNERYVYYMLNSYPILKQIGILTNGSTQPSLSLKEIRNIKVAVGSNTEQQKIATILSEADAKIEKEQIQKAQLEALKKGLMQQLLTGKKRVKV